MAGQQAGVAADFDGDGIQEPALATGTGNIVILRRDKAKGGKLALAVRLPVGMAGPAKVTARDGKRNLGARLVNAAQPAFFGKKGKGPLVLEWLDGEGKKITKQVILLRPMRFELPL